MKEQKTRIFLPWKSRDCRGGKSVMTSFLWDKKRAMSNTLRAVKRRREEARSEEVSGSRREKKQEEERDKLIVGTPTNLLSGGNEKVKYGSSSRSWKEKKKAQQSKNYLKRGRTRKENGGGSFTQRGDHHLQQPCASTREKGRKNDGITASTRGKKPTKKKIYAARRLESRLGDHEKKERARLQISYRGA